MYYIGGKYEISELNNSVMYVIIFLMHDHAHAERDAPTSGGPEKGPPFGIADPP